MEGNLVIKAQTYRFTVLMPHKTKPNRATLLSVSSKRSKTHKLQVEVTKRRMVLLKLARAQWRMVNIRDREARVAMRWKWMMRTSEGLPERGIDLERRDHELAGPSECKCDCTIMLCSYPCISLTVFDNTMRQTTSRSTPIISVYLASLWNVSASVPRLLMDWRPRMQ